MNQLSGATASRSPFPRVTVVGAGVSGLSAALELSNDMRVNVLADKRTTDTTSASAAAVWGPFLIGPSDRVTKWSTKTFERFAHLAKTAPESGVRMRHGRRRAVLRAGKPWWRDLPNVVIVERSDDTETFEAELPIIDMPRYLPWLEDQLLVAGVQIDTRHLERLDDIIETDVIVNCSGLGARSLVGDYSVRPLRGQLVEVTCPGIDTFVVDETDEDGLAAVYPRIQTVILGGVTSESDSVEIDDAATQSIVQRCERLDPRLRDAKIVRVLVGLRPMRPTVRLEVDTSGGTIPIVHNYGHGGAGVSVSWGCAEEVRSLCAALVQ